MERIVAFVMTLLPAAAGFIPGYVEARGIADSDIPAVLRGTSPDTSSGSHRGVTLSTNAVAWGFAVANARVDYALSERFSVGTPVYYSPWFTGERHAVRVLGFQPELRWWPGAKSRTDRQAGHFLGVHATVAWYNVRWGDMRYQDRGRPALGAGVSYGYRLMLSEAWGMEFTLGAGVINTRYDRFYNTKNGRLADTRQTTYFGVDNIGISISYSW